MTVTITRCSAGNLEHEGHTGTVRPGDGWTYDGRPEVGVPADSGPIVDLGWALCYAAEVKPVVCPACARGEAWGRTAACEAGA